MSEYKEFSGDRDSWAPNSTKNMTHRKKIWQLVYLRNPISSRRPQKEYKGENYLLKQYRVS